MKYIIILVAIALSSCSDRGSETVKVSSHLTIVTSPLRNVNYPNYKSGDSVVVWRSLSGSIWHIDTDNDKVYSSDLICYKKGVIK